MEKPVSRRAFIVGVGMTKFEKPESRDDFDYPQMAKEAVTKALKDAGVKYSDIQAAAVGYVYGDSTCGQRALYESGMTGIPVYNVNNNCSTGSTALLLAKQLIGGGQADCVMALGFEKMEKGSLNAKFTDRTSPLDRHIQAMVADYGYEPAPPMAQVFGNAGREHMKRYGTKPETFAKIAAKNHKHSVNNPYSQFRDEYTVSQIMQSPSVFAPLTKLQCCPTSDGSAAVVIVNEEFVSKHNLQAQAVEILAMHMTTDLPSSFNQQNAMKLAGYDMTKLAAEQAFKTAAVSVEDVDVIELHDCFSANELISYEALGLCPQGGAEAFVERGDNTYGGKYVVNPSGGLISKGHPLGATGLAQCTELCWQLRGLAGKRQVPKAKLALQHNIGLGGAAIVALYRAAFPQYLTAKSHESPVDSARPVSGGGGDTGGGGGGVGGGGSDDISDEEKAFKSATVINDIRNMLKKDGARMVQKLKGVYCFKVKKGEGEGVWVVDVKNGSGSVTFGSKEKADCTMTMADDDMFDMMTGKLNSQQAFMKGKLRISGNMSLAMKLREILPPTTRSKL